LFEIENFENTELEKEQKIAAATIWNTILLLLLFFVWGLKTQGYQYSGLKYEDIE